MKLYWKNELYRLTRDNWNFNILCRNNAFDKNLLEYIVDIICSIIMTIICLCLDTVFLLFELIASIKIRR